MTIPNEPYVILSSERVVLGFRVRAERAAELVDKYSPSSIMPEWLPVYPLHTFDVARVNRAS